MLLTWIDTAYIGQRNCCRVHIYSNNGEKIFNWGFESNFDFRWSSDSKLFKKKASKENICKMQNIHCKFTLAEKYAPFQDVFNVAELPTCEDI